MALCDPAAPAGSFFFGPPTPRTAHRPDPPEAGKGHGVRGYTKKPADWGWIWKAAALVALLALVLPALSACGGDDDNEPAPAPGPVTAADVERSVAPALDVFPLTVTDDTGVEVTLEARPERVVAVLPSVVDLVADLGLVDRLVGVDDFSLAKAPDAVSVGGNNFTFNIEAIAELQPDLVLVAVGGTEELVQQARALGFPVYSLAYPDRLATMLEQLRTLGRLLGDEAAGETLADDLGARLEAVSQTVAAGAGRPPRVYLEVDQSTPAQPFSVGPGSLHQEIIELAGGANIFAGAEGAFPQVNWESIIAADPEVILLLNSKEFADELSFNPISAAEVGERTGWAEIAAVQDGMVVPLPGTLFNVGVGLLDALERVAEILAEAQALIDEAA